MNRSEVSRGLDRMRRAGVPIEEFLNVDRRRLERWARGGRIPGPRVKQLAWLLAYAEGIEKARDRGLMACGHDPEPSDGRLLRVRSTPNDDVLAVIHRYEAYRRQREGCPMCREADRVVEASTARVGSFPPTNPFEGIWEAGLVLGLGIGGILAALVPTEANAVAFLAGIALGWLLPTMGARWWYQV